VRSTRDLLNMLAQITDKGAGFCSLADAWSDTTTSHGRLMFTSCRALRQRALAADAVQKHAARKTRRGDSEFDCSYNVRR
jgi:DNA invertase Pin-like site-specific DNA recombinase